VDFGLSDEHAALQATARQFVDRHCPPRLAKEWDEVGTYPEHLAFLGNGDGADAAFPLTIYI
jgi:alkylation response protein AidB-like acyl-CoA dehydrogenase